MRPFLPTTENRASDEGGQRPGWGHGSHWGEGQKLTYPMQCEIKAVWCDHLTDALPLSGRSTTLSTPSKAETPMS